MNALEDPGGFVRQVLFIPSGGQDTTGKVAKYDAVPDSASVPPAQPTIMIGLSELLYSAMTDCKRPGTDALSGTASYLSKFPVVSCPPDGMNNTCLTNPPGSSNAFIVKPSNIAKFAAQMFARQ